jgi:hypothetical protein
MSIKKEGKRDKRSAGFTRIICYKGIEWMCRRGARSSGQWDR